LGWFGTRAAPVQQVARPFPLPEVLDVCPSPRETMYDADDNDR
jgi:hypothetical protein